VIKSNKRIKLILCGLALVAAVYLIFFSEKKPETASKGLSRFSVQTFEQSQGWGYRIYEDTIPVIEQKNLPGIPGNLAFANEVLARKTGELVCKKLDQGIFPPTISPAELDSMGVKY
jgi:hypothetical protein